MSETKEQKNAKVMIEMQAENKRLEQLCGEFSKGVAKFTLLASKYADEADKLQAELDSLKSQKGMTDMGFMSEGAAEKIEQLKAENDELRVYEKFYTHIRTELTERYPERHFCPVVCKLCGKTFQKITGKSEIFEQTRKGDK